MSEREDLDQLIRSNGWLHFQEYVRREWSVRLEQLLLQAAADREDVIALQKIRQVLAAKREVERMVKWPQERLAELTRAEQARDAAQHEPLSRRGSL